MYLAAAEQAGVVSATTRAQLPLSHAVANSQSGIQILTSWRSGAHKEMRPKSSYLFGHHLHNLRSSKYGRHSTIVSPSRTNHGNYFQALVGNYLHAPRLLFTSSRTDAERSPKR